MQIIMPTLVFIGLTNIMGIQMLVPLGREKVVLYSEVAGAIVDLALNAVLIPRMAAAGAAIGTLVAEMAVWCVQYAALRKDVAEAYTSIKVYAILLALVVGTGASLWVKLLNLGSFVTLVLSAMLFFGAYGMVLLVTKEPLICEITAQAVSKLKGP